MAEAPAYVCQRLADFTPSLRLGWDGESQCFALLQLFHKYDAVRSYREFWNHGPTFSKKGRPMRDWDPLTHRALYIIRLSEKAAIEYDGEMTKDGEPVFWDPALHGWGYLFKLVKQWARPIAARKYKSAAAQARSKESHVDDMSRDIADRVYRSGQCDGSGAPIVARKFIDRTVNQKRRDNGELSFDQVDIPAPPQGWQSSLDRDIEEPDNLGSLSMAP